MKGPKRIYLYNYPDSRLHKILSAWSEYRDLPYHRRRSWQNPAQWELSRRTPKILYLPVFPAWREKGWLCEGSENWDFRNIGSAPADW